MGDGKDHELVVRHGVDEGVPKLADQLLADPWANLRSRLGELRQQRLSSLDFRQEPFPETLVLEFEVTDGIQKFSLGRLMIPNDRHRKSRSAFSCTSLDGTVRALPSRS